MIAQLLLILFVIILIIIACFIFRCDNDETLKTNSTEKI